MDSDSLSSFQHGYYTLFKGDVRIQSFKDEWVFADVDILKQVVIRAVRMGLRLHQDHFQNEMCDEPTLHENIAKFDAESVIAYERDPVWRRAVLSNVASLLSLRHQFSDYSDQYKVVMLNKSHLSFRVIKLNKECVRSFWAGQQHELIFLRNKNHERGSIQNAKQVLRNIINSSCDQPIGYPIYVSPLTTSYSSTHKQLARVIGPEFSFRSLFNVFARFFARIRNNCIHECSGRADRGGAGGGGVGGVGVDMTGGVGGGGVSGGARCPPSNMNVSFSAHLDSCHIGYSSKLNYKPFFYQNERP